MRLAAALFLLLFFLPASVLADQLEDGETALRNQDLQKAAQLLQPLAEQGNSNAQVLLGDLYKVYGGPQGNKIDFSEAMKWYRKAAEQGNAKGQVRLGQLYAGGTGEKPDYAEAFKWLHMAAGQGNMDGQLMTGRLYQNGWGVKQDCGEALALFQKAAAQGDGIAQSLLRKSPLCPPATPAARENNFQAMKRFLHPSDTDVEAIKAAAEKGDANAQVELGGMYQGGRGVKQDSAEAIKWYLKAAEQGESQAQFLLGVTYSLGMAGRPNYEEAMKWYLKSADQENYGAQDNIGRMYEMGTGVPQNNQEAYFWYSLAARDKRITDFSAHRDRASQQLTPEQRAAVDKRVAEWRPAPAPAAAPPSPKP